MLDFQPHVTPKSSRRKFAYVIVPFSGFIKSKIDSGGPAYVRIASSCELLYVFRGVKSE